MGHGRRRRHASRFRDPGVFADDQVADGHQLRRHLDRLKGGRVASAARRPGGTGVLTIIVGATVESGACVAVAVMSGAQQSEIVRLGAPVAPPPDRALDRRRDGRGRSRRPSLPKLGPRRRRRLRARRSLPAAASLALKWCRPPTSPPKCLGGPGRKQSICAGPDGSSPSPRTDLMQTGMLSQSTPCLNSR